jgi:hypothetical protein
MIVPAGSTVSFRISSDGLRDRLASRKSATGWRCTATGTLKPLRLFSTLLASHWHWSAILSLRNGLITSTMNLLFP